MGIISRKVIATKQVNIKFNPKLLRAIALSGTVALSSLYCAQGPDDTTTTIPQEVVDPAIVITDYKNGTEDITTNNEYVHDAFPVFKWARPSMGWNLVKYSWAVDNGQFYDVGNSNSVWGLQMRDKGITLVNGRTYTFKVKAVYPSGEERVSQITFTMNTDAPLVNVKENEAGTTLATSLECSIYSSLSNLFSYTGSSRTPYISWSILHATDKDNVIGYIYSIRTGAEEGVEKDVGTATGVQITEPLELNKTYVISVQARYKNGTLSPKTQMYYRPVEDTDIGVIYIGPKNEYYTTMLRTSSGGYCFLGYNSQVIPVKDSTGAVTGSATDQNVIVSVYDKDMTPLFHQSFGGSGNEEKIQRLIVGQKQAVITDDNALLFAVSAGSTDGNVVGNHGAYDILVIKMDLATGNVLWQKTLGTSAFEYAPTVTKAPDGTYRIVYVSGNGTDRTPGTCIEALGTSGNTLWMKEHAQIARKVVPLDSGDLLIVSNIQKAGTYERIMTTTRYSLAGDLVSSVTVDNLSVMNIQPMAGGRIIVSGSTYDSTEDGLNARAVVLGADLSILHDTVYGGSGMDYFLEAHELSTGGVILVGLTQSNDRDVAGNHGASDIWVVETDADGALVGQTCVGSIKGDNFVASTLLSDDSLALIYADGTIGAKVVRVENGAVVWSNGVPVKGAVINDIREDTDGNILVMGSVPGSRGMNGWVFKFDKATGQIIAIKG